MAFHVTYFSHRPIHQIFAEAFQRYLDEDIVHINDGYHSPYGSRTLWIGCALATRRATTHQTSRQSRILNVDHYVVITTQEMIRENDEPEFNKYIELLYS